MSDFALRPRSASEIVDAAFQVYRRNALPFVVATGLVYVPWLLIRVVVLEAARSSVLLVGILSPILFVALALAYTLMTATLLKLGAHAVLGEPVDPLASMIEVLPRLVPVLVAGLLVTLLTMLGTLVFIVGAFYVVARYFAVAPLVVVARVGAIESLGRSAKLSEGLKWHILGTLALVWVIYMALAFGTGVAGVFLGPVGVQVAMTVFTVVVYPVVALTQLVLYYDARIRAEGFDLEVMTEGIELPPPGEASPTT